MVYTPLTCLKLSLDRAKSALVLVHIIVNDLFINIDEQRSRVLTQMNLLQRQCKCPGFRASVIYESAWCCQLTAVHALWRNQVHIARLRASLYTCCMVLMTFLTCPQWLDQAGSVMLSIQCILCHEQWSSCWPSLVCSAYRMSQARAQSFLWTLHDSILCTEECEHNSKISHV